MSVCSFTRTAPFRKLPKHVLETICGYVMRGGTNTTNSDQSCDRSDLIYSICPEWTEVALEHCFSTVDLTLDVIATGFCSSHLYTQMCVHMDKLCHVSKTVNINMCLYDLVSGRAAHMLAQSPFSSLVFEAVRRVRINFDYASDLASFPTHFDADTAQSLYKQLMHMFPYTRTVYMNKCRMYSYQPVVTHCAFAKCVADLHEKYTYAAISLNWDIRALRNSADMSPQLTKIDFYCGEFTGFMSHLVRRCADTLETLRLGHYQYHDKNSIFEEPNGRAVAYHRLKYLRLFNITNTTSSKYSGRSPTFLLPRLTHLVMLGGFPFRDGALFKSVSSTLVSVRISTTMSLLDIINRFNVFSDTCCPHVSHISIFSTWDRFYVEKYNAYYLFLSIVSRRLKSLKVSNAYVTDIFMDLVMQVPMLDTIQSLSMNGTVLSFNSLCSLVESLPQMTQIRFQSIEVYEDYDIPDAIGLYEQIIEKRAVLSTCLKFCQVIHHDPLDTTNDLAICGILLSVMCPRFTRLIVSSTARNRYDSFVRKAIQQEPFSRYAERLSRLIFNDTPELKEPSI